MMVMLICLVMFMVIFGGEGLGEVVGVQFGDLCVVVEILVVFYVGVSVMFQVVEVVGWQWVFQGGEDFLVGDYFVVVDDFVVVGMLLVVCQVFGEVWYLWLEWFVNCFVEVFVLVEMIDVVCDVQCCGEIGGMDVVDIDLVVFVDLVDVVFFFFVGWL